MRWSALWSWSLSLEESLLASLSSCCTVRDISGTLTEALTLLSSKITALSSVQFCAAATFSAAAAAGHDSLPHQLAPPSSQARLGMSKLFFIFCSPSTNWLDSGRTRIERRRQFWRSWTHGRKERLREKQIYKSRCTSLVPCYIQCS